jgi:hypothetical protein
MATTKITNPDLFDLGSLDTALKLPSGTTAERPTSPSTGEWRYNTDNNLIEFYDGGAWRDLQSEDIPPTPSENFNTVLYDGTSATHAITGVGFEPDLVWIKDRNNAEQPILNDSTRGAGYDLSPDRTNAEAYRPTGFISFDSDGFTLGTDGGGVVNDSARGPYVAWCWKANGGTTSSNTDGTITSTVQANTKAGFSIVKYTGTFAAATVGHGLSQSPEMIIVKNLVSTTASWRVWHTDLGGGDKYLSLNELSAVGTATSVWNGTVPTSTVFSVANDTGSNGSGNDMIAYCFKSVAGYSKFGSYVGNLTSQTNIITGFEPAFVMIKCSSGFNSGDWVIYDNKRNPTNPKINPLLIRPFAEQNALLFGINFNSNGFSIPTTCTTNSVNQTGYTYIYMAFAADPSPAPVLPDSFANKLYTGTGSDQSITGLGFSPNFSWFKSRSNASGNVLHDTVRGPLSRIFSNSTAAASTTADGFVSFDSDGFTLDGTGSGGDVNFSGRTYVAWNWKANSIPTINTDGTIQSVVSANANSGFSIVSYTGNGTAGATVGHGLSAAPELIIVKITSGSIGNWAIFHKDLGATKVLQFTTGAAGTNSAWWNNTAPTSSIFSLGTISDTNANNSEYIAYCFHSVDGYSKIGSYTGNGSATGPVITTGFQPDFVMIKSSSLAGTAWMIFDSARSTSNPRQLLLQPQSSAVEQNVGNAIDFNADNFQLTDTNDSRNQSGQTYIYMAFKENPVQYPIASGEMGYLVAAGGGGGGFNIGAGGGAGGLRTSYGLTSGGGASAESNITLTSGTYTITIGAGGIAGTYTPSWVQGGDGTDSSIAASGLTTITSIGGGGGGTGISAQTPDVQPGRAGGSGGGGSRGPNKPGGSGTANQGFAGGASNVTNGDSAGGGGGATQAGQTPSSAGGGADGGNGLTSAITGSNSGYAGGGGGGSYTGAPTVGLGKHGGGAGVTTGTPNAGAVNTGGGAGGGGGSGVDSARIGGVGGSGVVILRLNTSDYSGTTTGSPTVTTVGTETVLTYTGSGTYVHS